MWSLRPSKSSGWTGGVAPSLFATADPAEGRAVEAALRELGIRCEVEQMGPTTVVLVDTDRADQARARIAEHVARRGG